MEKEIPQNYGNYEPLVLRGTNIKDEVINLKTKEESK